MMQQRKFERKYSRPDSFDPRHELFDWNNSTVCSVSLQTEIPERETWSDSRENWCSAPTCRLWWGRRLCGWSWFPPPLWPLGWCWVRGSRAGFCRHFSKRSVVRLLSSEEQFRTWPSEQSSSVARLKLLRRLPLLVTHFVLTGLSLSQLTAAWLFPLSSGLLRPVSRERPSSSTSTVVGTFKLKSPNSARVLMSPRLSTRMFVSGTITFGLQNF